MCVCACFVYVCMCFVCACVLCVCACVLCVHVFCVCACVLCVCACVLCMVCVHVCVHVFCVWCVYMCVFCVHVCGVCTMASLHYSLLHHIMFTLLLPIHQDDKHGPMALSTGFGDWSHTHTAPQHLHGEHCTQHAGSTVKQNGWLCHLVSTGCLQHLSHILHWTQSQDGA